MIVKYIKDIYSYLIMSEISVPKKRGRKKGSTNKNKNQSNINENISETPVPKKEVENLKKISLKMIILFL